MKILICEDNILATKTQSIILGRAGYQTDIAMDGNEAMEKLSSNNYNLILIDIHLPYHSGLELIKYLRADLKKDTPVIVVSSFSNPQIQKQAYELGIENYLIKPIDPDDFIEKIRLALNN